MFLDYANNVKVVSQVPGVFSKSKASSPGDLGRVDPYFIPAGAKAFQKDIPSATVNFLPTGHFALETHLEEIVAAMREFLMGHDYTRSWMSRAND
jgi:hypothetical protein